MSKSFYNFIDNEVSEIVTANLFKDERLISTPQQTAIKLSSGKEVLNFCANDYLGLANNDQIKKMLLQIQLLMMVLVWLQSGLYVVPIICTEN